MRWRNKLKPRNQNGQVALFVALIFQVVFIFFAVFINVGLLVHHKINLQNSTDLAAYYGAMKQAESLNAIAHVNFQMRQAWKLLAWRYRVFGTFGLQKWDGGMVENPFPINLSLGGGSNVFVSPGSKCSGAAGVVDSLDVPFACWGHKGMGGWLGGNENNCRTSCNHLLDLQTSVSGVPTMPTLGHGVALANSVNNALRAANSNLADLCERFSMRNLGMITAAIGAYRNEIEQKRTFIQMLGTNLSQPANRFVDLDGGSVLTGAENTFNNNLTEANRSGRISFTTYNGLGDSTDARCKFNGTSSDGDPFVANQQFLNEIKFRVIPFFVHACRVLNRFSNPPSYQFAPVSIWNGSYNDFNVANYPLPAGESPDPYSEILRYAATNFSVGFEKNPWCQVYYGARAQTEPKIPFLPVAKIRLSAVSFAKPFGGSVGPRYYKNWPNGSLMSTGGGKVDEALPNRDIGNMAGVSGMAATRDLLPNYGMFVGDTEGLRNREIVGAYHDMIIHRTPAGNATYENASTGKNYEPSPTDVGLSQPSSPNWPSFDMWRPIQNPAAGIYDYLSVDPSAGTGRNSFFRDLEISVLAPNQFELTYYSIDPDFYNNVFAKLRGIQTGPRNNPGSFAAIKAAANNFGPSTVNDIKPDYGQNESLGNAGQVASRYSVRHQLMVASRVVKAAVRRVNGLNISNENIFSFIPNYQSSLLTGWTFQNFSTYAQQGNNSTFPSNGPDAVNTMTFGKCNDQWNRTPAASSIVGNESELFGSPLSDGRNLPPIPGNCVTGGRTGYSVKLISPEILTTAFSQTDIGGPGLNGPIINPVNTDFLSQ